MFNKLTKPARRTLRTRARIKRFSSRIRLSVYRSSKHIYAQIVDVTKGKTVATATDVNLSKKLPKTQAAFEVGKQIAQKALAAGVKEAVFDRGCYKYHGRVKMVCEGAREGKLTI